MTHFEKICGIAIGGVLGSLVSFVLYKQLLLSMLGMVVGGYFGLKKYKTYLLDKQNKQLLIEFKECLDFLNANYLVGKNTMQSFHFAAHDCYIQFGEKSYFYIEFTHIVTQLQNGQTLETVLHDLSQRINLVDITQFINVFITVYRKGGNLKQLIDNTKTIISRKIEMTLQMQTMLHEQKRQITILLIMPYVLLSIVDFFGLSVNQSNDINTFMLRSVSGGLFVLGYILTKKMIMKLEGIMI